MLRLLLQSFSIIKKDSFIVVPSIIGAFLTTWLIYTLKIDPANISTNSNIIIYLIITWLINIFLQLLISDFGKGLITKGELIISTSIKRSLLKYIPTLLWNLLILFVLFLAIFILTLSKYSWNFVILVMTDSGFATLSLFSSCLVWFILDILYVSRETICYFFWRVK